MEVLLDSLLKFNQELYEPMEELIIISRFVGYSIQEVDDSKIHLFNSNRGERIHMFFNMRSDEIIILYLFVKGRRVTSQIASPLGYDTIKETMEFTLINDRVIDTIKLLTRSI